jgi:hypothetical protein
MNQFTIVTGRVEQARQRTLKLRREDPYAFRQAVDEILGEIEERLEDGYSRLTYDQADYLEELGELVGHKSPVPHPLVRAHEFALEIQQRDRCRRQGRPYISIGAEDRREGRQSSAASNAARRLRGA